MNRVDWKPISTVANDQFVLVACKSQYVGLQWIYRVAKLVAGYADPWRDECNNGLQDSGHVPEWWTGLPNIPDSK